MLPQYLVRFEYRAFDRRWIYWEPETNLLGRKSPDFFPQVFEGNAFIEARQKESLSTFSRGMVVSVLADNFGNGFSNFFPKLVRPARQSSLFAGEHQTRSVNSNLSEQSLDYLSKLECKLDKVEETTLLFDHFVSTLHSPAYRTENAGALRQDWPRIPLPARKDLLLASAELGRKVAALLDTETPVAGVNSGSIRAELKIIGVAAAANGNPLNREAGDFDVTAGWGHGGKGGIAMPGKGKMTPRDYSAAERAAIEQGISELGLRRRNWPSRTWVNRSATCT